MTRDALLVEGTRWLRPQLLSVFRRCVGARRTVKCRGVYGRAEVAAMATTHRTQKSADKGVTSAH